MGGAIGMMIKGGVTVKRLVAWLMVAMMAMGGAAASATNVETGEPVFFADGALRVYDRVVFQATTPDHDVPLSALRATASDLLEKRASGEVTSLRIAGLENFFGETLAGELAELPVEDQIDAVLYALNAADKPALSSALEALKQGLDSAALVDPSTGALIPRTPAEEIAPEAFAQASLQNGRGYIISGSARIPFVRVAFEVVYADQGEYAGRSESERTYIQNNNYVFARQGAAEEEAWYLASTVQVAKDFFQ